MQRSEARALLDLPATYSSVDLELAFRRAAMDAHPDRGGDVERFQALIESRRLLRESRLYPASIVVIDNRPGVRRWLRRLRGGRARQPARVR